LQQALLIDARYAPAYDQLATYYWAISRQRAGAETRRLLRLKPLAEQPDPQTLQLALRTAAKGLKWAPRNAALYNTKGLIHVELGDLPAAVRAFDQARRLAASLVNAHLNYGAVQLQLRQFAKAERAYRDALEVRPTDYEAHLGLALALRGRIGELTGALVAAAEQLHKAQRLAPERPEAYFNEAVLLERFAAPAATGTQETTRILKRTVEAYETFVAKARPHGKFRGALDYAKARIAELKARLAKVRPAVPATSNPPPTALIPRAWRRPSPQQTMAPNPMVPDPVSKR